MLGGVDAVDAQAARLRSSIAASSSAIIFFISVLLFVLFETDKGERQNVSTGVQSVALPAI